MMGALLSALLLRYSNHVCLKQYHTSKGIPMPAVPHKVLAMSDIGDRHVLIIGDVHGCLDELKELLTKANELTHHQCMFLFCGDIVNKGPKNKETLDFVRSLGDKAYVVRGNHENHILAKLCADNKEKVLRTVKSKYHWLQSLTDSDVEYLNQLPYTISIPHLEVIVVHAGLLPGLPLERQAGVTMTKIRNISDNECVEDINIVSTVYNINNILTFLLCLNK